MKKNILFLLLVLPVLAFISFILYPEFFSGISYNKSDQNIKAEAEGIKTTLVEPVMPVIPPLDVVVYDAKMLEIANNPPDPIVYESVKNITIDKNGKSITKITKVPLDPQPIKTHLWPVKAAYPNAGALLPFNRIIAYYGNLYSKQMGVLGQYTSDEMLQRLEAEVNKWKIADPSTPVIPALHYIAIVAQGYAGSDGKYIAHMPDSEINKVLAIAAKINALVFLDVQVGLSDLQTEVPTLEKYLKLPNVHLGVDPEFSMKTGARPGKVVGTLDAIDINFAANYLAKIVQENNLPPKILVVHRYTQKMVTNYQNIKPLPEVQIVMDMDGWGDKAHKLSTYQQYVYKEPVQFTGFKLFYKNDILTQGTTLMTPEDLLKLNPQPSYIQFQ